MTSPTNGRLPIGLLVTFLVIGVVLGAVGTSLINWYDSSRTPGAGTPEVSIAPYYLITGPAAANLSMSRFCENGTAPPNSTWYCGTWVSWDDSDSYGIVSNVTVVGVTTYNASGVGGPISQDEGPALVEVAISVPASGASFLAPVIVYYTSYDVSI